VKAAVSAGVSASAISAVRASLRDLRLGEMRVRALHGLDTCCDAHRVSSGAATSI
jgi:hypothetical protein